MMPVVMTNLQYVGALRIRTSLAISNEKLYYNISLISYDTMHYTIYNFKKC